jgi:hypothetical protein
MIVRTSFWDFSNAGLPQLPADLFLIPLARSPHWPLATPAQTAQNRPPHGRGDTPPRTPARSGELSGYKSTLELHSLESIQPCKSNSGRRRDRLPQFWFVALHTRRFSKLLTVGLEVIQ